MRLFGVIKTVNILKTALSNECRSRNETRATLDSPDLIFSPKIKPLPSAEGLFIVCRDIFFGKLQFRTIEER